MLPEHVERSFLDTEYSFVAVRRILPTRFAKQKFAQLRTGLAEIRTATVVVLWCCVREIRTVTVVVLWCCVREIRTVVVLR